MKILLLARGAHAKAPSEAEMKVGKKNGRDSTILAGSHNRHSIAGVTTGGTKGGV